jgi:hypothetical protein
MKRIILVLFVLVLGLVAFGFYRGWFAFSSHDADDGTNKVNVNLTVDRDKMQEDAQAAKKKTTELTGNVTGGKKNPDENATDNTKSND